ncbi:MAG TPA: hypothetical protein VGB44_04110 [Flavobacterium sp.]|jgi:hypothetical protein
METTLIINYPRKQQRLLLIFGIIFFCTGVIALVVGSRNYWLVGNIVLGLLHIFNAVYRLRTPYVTITDKYIRVADYLNKKICLRDIVSMKYSGGTYTIRSNNKKIVINLDNVDKEGAALIKATLGPMLKNYLPTDMAMSG